MLNLSQGLTRDAFVSSRDIHRRNKKSCSLVSFSLAKRRTNYQSIAEFACIACCSLLVSKPELSFHI